jgi:hypothetical protein
MKRLLRHSSAGPVSPSGPVSPLGVSHKGRTTASRVSTVLMLVLAPFALALALNVVDFALGSPVSRLVRSTPASRPTISYATPDLPTAAHVAVKLPSPPCVSGPRLLRGRWSLSAWRWKRISSTIRIDCLTTQPPFRRLPFAGWMGGGSDAPRQRSLIDVQWGVQRHSSHLTVPTHPCRFTGGGPQPVG